MKTKLLAFCLPVGLIITAVYFIINRFVTAIPDVAGYPIMIVSIILMLTGIAYNSFCMKRKKNPFKFN